MRPESDLYILPVPDAAPRSLPKSLSIPLQPVRLATALIGLLLFTGSLTLFLPGTLMTAVRYTVFSLSLFFIFRDRAQKTLDLIVRDACLFIAIAIACLSFSWSDYPNITIESCFELFRVSVFALFLSVAFSRSQQFKLLLINFGIGAILSLGFAVMLPSIGIDRAVHIGAWKGIYNNKNGMGAIMVIGSLLNFISLLFRKHLPSTNAIIFWFGISLSSFLVLMTKSKSSLVSLLVIALFVASYRQYQWKGKLSALFLSLGILISGVMGLLLINNWEPLLLSLDRDPTLTGRTIIWRAALNHLMERPFLGFGQGAFWIPGSEQQLFVAKHFSMTADYLPPHSHNGFIDILIAVGFIGLTFFTINLVTNIGLALRRAYRHQTPVDWFPLTILALLCLDNLVESKFMRTADVGIFWILYILTSVCLKYPNPDAVITQRQS